MPKFSVFAPFGHLKFSAKHSRLQVIYDLIREGHGDAYGPNDRLQEARDYAAARCVAISDGEIERAKNERRPLKTQAMLAEHEADWGLAPSANGTRAERRRALYLQRQVLRGSRLEALTDALQTLLGSDFVGIVPLKQLFQPPVLFPPDGQESDRGNYQRGAEWRLYTVTEDTSLPGVLDLHLVDKIAGQKTLRPGDKFVIGAENLGLCEVCTISALASAPVTDANGITTNHINATVGYAHDPGSIVSTQPFPMQITSQRHFLVQVSPSAALNAVKRRAIDTLMQRLVRGLSTWEIQDPTSGPWEIGTGALSVTPLG